MNFSNIKKFLISNIDLPKSQLLIWIRVLSSLFQCPVKSGNQLDGPHICFEINLTEAKLYPIHSLST